ncbi:MAG TPA: pilus assembly protein PilM [Kofleriaceae bacterium]|jgi:general secretion pathway protein L
MASRVYAVDLGAWSVKIAIATPGLRGTSLLNIVERIVPPGDDAREQRACRTLATMIDELRLSDEAGYLGVSGDNVFTQVVEFGFKNLRRSELDKAVGGELENVVPVDLEDMVYAYEPIPAPPSGLIEPGEQVRGRVAPPSEGMRVLTYAMRKSRAEELIQLAKLGGFEPRGILPAGGGAARLVERVPSLAQARLDGPVAVIDIGHERSDVVVMHGGKAVFSRSIARAGKQVTEAIARFWRLDFAKAEEAKHRDGFIASTSEPATTEAWKRIHDVLVQELAPFARDVRQTLAACRARTGFQPIAALLVGGGSRLRGFGAFMTEQIGIPSWRLTGDDIAALAGLRLAPQAANLPIESAALTIGMAYDCAGGRPQFDLRSGALAVKVDLSFLRAKLVPAGAGLLAILAFASLSAYADLYRLRKEQRVLDQRLADETTQFYGSAKSPDDVLGTSSGSGGPGGTDSPMPRMTAYDILLEINSHIPTKDKITLDVEKVSIDNSKIEIDGTAKSSQEVDTLVGELKKIDCFHKEVNPGSLDPVGDLKKFHLSINSYCM